jgi:hypothetical protein
MEQVRQLCSIGVKQNLITLKEEHKLGLQVFEMT